MSTLKRTLALALVATLPLVACSRKAKDWSTVDASGGSPDGGTSCEDCRDDEVCVQGTCSPRGTAVVEAAVGHKKGQLGVTIGNESASLAPQSLAVNSLGEVWILDQENQRLQLFDGRTVQQEIRLDSGTYQDVVLLGKNRIVLMDAKVAQELVVLDPSGKVLSRVRMYGMNLDDPQLADGMESREDGVWVGYEGRMVRVLAADGKAAPDRLMVYGHLSYDGKDVTSIRIRKALLNLFKRNRTGPIKATEVTHELDRPITNIGEVHSDAAGNLYVTCGFWGDEAAPEQRLLVFDGKLKLVRSTVIPSETDATDAEVFRRMDVTPAGEVYMLRAAKDTVKVRRF